MPSLALQETTCEDRSRDLRIITLSDEDLPKDPPLCRVPGCSGRGTTETLLIDRVHCSDCHGPCCGSDCCWWRFVCMRCGSAKEVVVCSHCGALMQMLTAGERYRDYECLDDNCTGIVVVRHPSADDLREHLEGISDSPDTFDANHRKHLPHHHDKFLFTSLLFCRNLDEYQKILIDRKNTDDDPRGVLASLFVGREKTRSFGDEDHAGEETMGIDSFSIVPKTTRSVYDNDIAVGTVLDIIFWPYGWEHDPENNRPMKGRIEIVSVQDCGEGVVEIIPCDDSTQALFRNWLDGDLSEEEYGRLDSREFLMEEIFSGKDFMPGELHFFVSCLDGDSPDLVSADEEADYTAGVPLRLRSLGFRRLRPNDIRTGKRITFVVLPVDRSLAPDEEICTGSAVIQEKNHIGNDPTVTLRIRRGGDMLKEMYGWQTCPPTLEFKSVSLLAVHVDYSDQRGIALQFLVQEHS